MNANATIAPGWQPIETAPKDGRQVLFWATTVDSPYVKAPATHMQVTARWFDNRAWFVCASKQGPYITIDQDRLIAWHNLPEPPK